MVPIATMYFFHIFSNEPSETKMKTIFTLLSVSFFYFSFSQDLLFKIDHDQTYKKLKWEEIQERKVTFNNNPITEKSREEFIPLKIQKDFFSGKKAKNLAFFILDTSKNNFSYNPIFFDSLVQFNATFSEAKSKTIGAFTSKIDLFQKDDFFDLSNALLHFGVIQTYAHLYAEVFHKKTIEAEETLTFKYHIVWHYCTNDCYDPEYEISIQFNLKTREILVLL